MFIDCNVFPNLSFCVDIKFECNAASWLEAFVEAERAAEGAASILGSLGGEAVDL